MAQRWDTNEEAFDMWNVIVSRVSTGRVERCGEAFVLKSPRYSDER
jgi:hypothetical protein